MKRRLATLALNLYPLAFRRRYGEEMRALLDEAPVRLLTVLDLLRGALAAHVRPPDNLVGLLDTDDRLRASTSGLLACWVVFAAAGFGFYGTTEDAPFPAASKAHALLGGAHFAIQALAVVASCALLVGALPLLVAALRQARHERGLRLLLSLPFMSVSAFASVTALLVWLANAEHAQRGTTAGHAAFIAWAVAGLGCGGVCVAASRKALFAVSVPRRRLESALVWGTVVSVAMGAIVLALAFYTAALQFDASELAVAQNGPLSATTTNALLIMQLITMAGMGTLATITTRRGWRALRSAPRHA